MDAGRLATRREPRVERAETYPHVGRSLLNDPARTRRRLWQLEPKYRHDWIDVFLDPALRGRGLGAEAVLRVVRHLIDERGHHRITIDPAAANVAAIRAYEKVGFRRVGVLRRAERDADGGGWHDCLLLELHQICNGTHDAAIARA